MATFPHFSQGTVVKGFGRGSKELGVPTANLPEDVVNQLPSHIDAGVYYGWASVNNGPVYKMVMSIGWNPYYKNTVKSMEAHLMHVFDEDFYGQTLKVCILGYLRPELGFSSLEELKAAIFNDIENAKAKLDEETNQKYKDHEYFRS